MVGVALLLGLRHDVQAADEQGGGRQRLLMDFGWKFTRGDVKDAETADFDDKGWRGLDLPHDWGAEGPLEQGNPSGGQGGYAPAGVGWYRKHFVTPAGWQGKQERVEFDGIYMNSVVYLNGKEIGGQAYGYTSFVCDMTAGLAAEGKENVLAVRVDNSVQPNSRWYTGSGIYRHVWAEVTGGVSVVPWGVYVSTPKVSEQEAEVQIATRVENCLMMGAGQVELTQEIVDPEGKIIGKSATSGMINRAVSVGSALDLAQKVSVTKPMLWSLEKPALYAVRTRLAVNGQQMDALETPFGIRRIEYDVDKGFLLNGERVKMLGVCLHQDGGAFGVAVPEAVWERRLKLLKVMGCNAIRCSHNPPAPEFLDLCDRLGFLVMDEAFDEWTSAKGQLKGSYSTMFNKEAEGDLRAMLRRDRNHPSVVMWSIGNEIPQQSQAAGAEIARKLTGICHEEDPTRPVTSACDNVHSPNPTKPEFIAALDIAGYNYVDRWGIHREIYFSDDREKYPGRKFVGTEDVGVGGVRGGYFGGGGGFGRGGGAPNSFGYASSMVRAEQLWKFNAVHDYVIGYFMWTGIDYLGEAGAWPRKGASSGVLDSCGFPKDGYYFYKSQWGPADEPVVHVLPNWNYPGEKGTVIPVVVYTNGPQVELVVNGKSFGTKSIVFPRPGAVRSWSDPTPAGTTGDLHLTWDVPYEPGSVKAIGKRNGQVVAQEEIKTAGAAAEIVLAVDKTKLDAGLREVAHVEVRLVDSEGNLVPTAADLVKFEVNGPGKVIAVDNGDQSAHEPYQASERKAFNGMCLAVVQGERGKEGRVRVVARAEGLKEASVDLDVSAGTKVVTLP
jgi:beta-galactosidase